MRFENIFSCHEIMKALGGLGISFEINDSGVGAGYSFKSLRSPASKGIYYVSPGLENAPHLEDSIVFHAGDYSGGSRNVYIQVEHPQLVFYQLMSELVARPKRLAGVHSTAIVGPDCELDPSASIGPYCVLDGCRVGADVELHSHVVVMPGTVIEDDVIIEPHCTVGATGVAWVWDPHARERVIQPQIGYTTIGRGTFLGSDVTIVRGSINETTHIGEGCVIAHGSKVGHGSLIGAGCHFANNVTIAGNVTMGEKCFIGAAAVIRPQVSLSHRIVVGAGAVVVQDAGDEGVLLKGVPAKPVILHPDASLRGVPRQMER